MWRHQFLVVVVLAGAASALAVQGPWNGPATVVSPVVAGQNAANAKLAVAPDGTVTAVWQRNNGTASVIESATRPPGGTFAPAIVLSPPSGPGQNAVSPQVAVGADGTVTAVWGRVSGGEVVEAATRPPGGAFAPATVVSQGAGAHVAIGPDGTTTAVWVQFDGSSVVVGSSTRPPGGVFGPATVLSPAGANTFAPRVAFGPDGTAIAVWSQATGNALVVASATRPPGGTFAPAIVLSPPPAGPGQNAVDARVAFAPDGTAIAVWTRSDGTALVIEASTRPPGGVFAPPTALTPSIAVRDAGAPQVAFGPDGTATAVWQRFDGVATVIEASTRPPGGTFTPAVVVSPPSSPGQGATNPQVAVAEDGTATVVYQRNNGTTSVIETATRPPGGTFAPATALSPAVAGQVAANAQVAVAPDGTATAAWQRSNGTATVIEAIGTANPPVPRQVPLITGTATAGSTLTCDGGKWSGAGTVAITWIRDTMMVASGATYAVDAADQGHALTCRARGSNPFGSVEATSAPVVVAVPVPPVEPPAPGATVPPATGAQPAPTTQSAVALPPAVAVRPGVLQLPRVSGTPRIGRTLRCAGARFADATSTRLAWLRNGKTIRNANRARYKLTRADRGKIITCQAIATGPGGNVTVVSLGVVVR